jgi:hypothetical protein
LPDPSRRRLLVQGLQDVAANRLVALATLLPHRISSPFAAKVDPKPFPGCQLIARVK